MLEFQQVDTAAVRLRSTARSRVMPTRGVAISSGGAAVVINGSTAEAVWSVMEPRLMAGCDKEELVTLFPPQGWPLIRSIMAQLDDHDLLREVEDTDGVPAVDSALVEHFEQLTRRPRAAAARLPRTTISITGTNTVLNECIRDAFIETGFPIVTASEIRGTGDGVDTVFVHRSSTVAGGTRPDPDESILTVLAVSAGGWHAAGPANAQPFPQDVDAVHRWMLAKAGSDRMGTEPVEKSYARNLVSAQLVLATLKAVAREVDAAETAAKPPLDPVQVLAGRPQFMVTSPDLVSEPHPVTTLTALDTSSGEKWHPVPTDPVGAEEELILGALEPLWAGLFSRFEGPTPGSLEQLPMGMAEAGTVGTGTSKRMFAGTGLTTAQARLDALSAASTHLAFDGFVPARHMAEEDAVNVSWSRQTAAADATALLLDRQAQWHPVGTPEEHLSPRTRRMWAALVLRYHRTLNLETGALSDGRGLHRCRVWVDGTWACTGIAARAEMAVEEALMRAAGIVQFSADSAPGHAAATIPPRGVAPMLTSSRDEILAWAAKHPHRITYLTPSGSEYWGRVGLYPVVATWL